MNTEFTELRELDCFSFVVLCCVPGYFPLAHRMGNEHQRKHVNPRLSANFQS